MNSNVSRREVVAGAVAALALPASGAAPDFSSCRADFPWNEGETFLNNAGWHPIGRHSIGAMQQYLEYKLKGPGAGRQDIGGTRQGEVKRLFAQLIHAKPTEIAFVQSTLMGENLVVEGLGIPGSGANVVTDELHYEGSLYLYKSLQKAGLDVRIAKRRDDWRIHAEDVAKLVDRRTRLVATSLVSYLNGYVQDARALADIAHAHGGYLYTDIVQAAGAVPIDVRAMGIDFAACSGYKWLMGDRGLGYLYVKEDLQNTAMKRTQYGDRQFAEFEYHILPHDRPGPYPVSWTPAKSGAGAYYEVGNLSNAAVACQSASLAYITKLGVENIRAHARPLTDRLRRELPRLGYPCITPEGNESPIVSFIVADPAATHGRLTRARVNAKVEWHHMRVSVSVYNNGQDVDRLLNALG
jgi:selenocysteine lyase/cysteine desulfurase